MTNGDVLNSWKEIATYVGRGVRTIQRWERELDFPIRRPRGKQRSAVIALKEDLDLWLRTPHGPKTQQAKHAAHQQNHDRLIRNTELLRSRTTVLLAQSCVLQKQIARTINIGAALRTCCRTRTADRKNWAELMESGHRDIGASGHLKTLAP
ncbi:MAG TPA: hypothetical protein VI685_25575 [Candidatus Angelobacter sp.]